MEDEMGTTCSKLGGEKKCMKNLGGNPEGMTAQIGGKY
jgi:hypothetical protein